jgi:hypothetical protein
MRGVQTAPMPRCRLALADVEDPPDTSALVACSDAQTALHVETMRRRLLLRRKCLLERNAGAAGDAMARARFQAVISALRRLQNPQLAAFARVPHDVVLSEPFNGLPSAIAPMPHDAARKLAFRMLGGPAPAELVGVLSRFGEPALTAAWRGETKISILTSRQRFAQASPAIKRCMPGIDDLRSPPAGLFVVEERRLLLRQEALRMACAHEFAHALDAVLARRPRSYFSFESEELRFYFATATGFINEYAASSLDEYFAESVRAYVEVNDSQCTWLPVTRQDLYLRDPRMFALVERLFATGFRRCERRSATRA